MLSEFRNQKGHQQTISCGASANLVLPGETAS
jgi:hypothetical protein